MSRAARIVRAVGIGYGYQLVVAGTGLALTPFLLSRLGVEEFGRWLVVGQVLGFLGLLDFGVTAILPREVARATGAAEPRGVAEAVRRATWLVWMQTPLVAVVAFGVWLGLASGWPDLSGPLAVILAGFALQFPLRLPGAVLTGLQDLEFCGMLSAGAWAVTTAVSVALVLAGWGLHALAVGWVVGQGVNFIGAWLRLRSRFPEARDWSGWPGAANVAAHLRPSAWTSVRQLALLLLNGVELIVVGWVLGPAAVVVYSCTVKLVAVVNNQPYLFALTTMPAVAELQAAGDPVRLWRACRVVGLGVLVMSGALGVAVVAVSSAFVPLWVGAEQYGGPELVLLAVLAMTARHLVYTMTQTVFALGFDRRLAAAAIADGMVTVGAMVGWVWLLGPLGVPLGSLTGAVLATGAVSLFTLASAEGVSPVRALLWAAPWAVRFAAVLGPVAAVSFTPVAATPVGAAALLVSGLAGYAAVSHSLLSRDPLREYRDRALGSFRRRFGMARRAPTPAVEGP